jgi:hypothetical protein
MVFALLIMAEVFAINDKVVTIIPYADKTAGGII